MKLRQADTALVSQMMIGGHGKSDPADASRRYENPRHAYQPHNQACRCARNHPISRRSGRAIPANIGRPCVQLVSVFLGPDDAELVALRIGQNGPSLVASLTDIDGSCPVTDEAIDLRFTFRGAGLGTWIEIEMHTILATLSSGLGMKQMPIAPPSAEPMTTSRWRSERMGQCRAPDSRTEPARTDRGHR